MGNHKHLGCKSLNFIILKQTILICIDFSTNVQNGIAINKFLKITTLLSLFLDPRWASLSKTNFFYKNKLKQSS